MTTKRKTYSAVIFGRREAVGWRGVRTGVGWFFPTHEFVRKSLNLDATDRSMRRREGQVWRNRQSNTLLHSSLVGNNRVVAVGGEVYSNSSTERMLSGDDALVL